MPEPSPSRRTHADLAAEARAALRAAYPDLQERIRAEVATWPPLTGEQRVELAMLLHPARGD